MLHQCFHVAAFLLPQDELDLPQVPPQSVCDKDFPNPMMGLPHEEENRFRSEVGVAKMGALQIQDVLNLDEDLTLAVLEPRCRSGVGMDAAYQKDCFRGAQRGAWELEDAAYQKDCFRAWELEDAG
jgi:hypothetical protein